MINSLRGKLTRSALALLVVLGGAESAWAQRNRNNGGGQPGGGGMFPQSNGGFRQGGGFPQGGIPMQPGMNGQQGGGLFQGNNQRRNVGPGGMNQGPFINPNDSLGGRNNGRRGNGGEMTVDPRTVPPNSGQPGGSFVIDPNTGQVVQIGPGQGQAPGVVAQPPPVATRTRVLDAYNRVIIQETGELTGESWDPVNQRYYPTPTATQAAAPAAPAAPAEPAKPPGPPANTVATRLAPASESHRRLVRSEIEKGGFLAFLDPEVDAALQEALFDEAAREGLFAMVRRKSTTRPDDLEILTRALEDLNADVVRIRLDAMEFTHEQYATAVDRIALTKVYNELVDAGIQPPARVRALLARLDRAASRAGVPRDRIRAASEQIQTVARIYDDLSNPDAAESDLAGVVPETVFTAVRVRGLGGTAPLLLAAETVLAPAVDRGASSPRLTIGSATAAELGLPIYGSNTLPLPDAGGQAPAGPVGLTFRVDPRAGADQHLWVVEANGQQSQHVIKAGAELPLAGRASAQVAHLDGKGGVTAWEVLPAGTYVFRRDESAWLRSREMARITLDNTANASPFHYRIDGVEGTVPARKSATLARPGTTTTLEFHRGIGDEVASKVVAGKDARAVVRLGGASSGLDLFQPEDRPPASTSDLALARTAGAGPRRPGGAPPRPPADAAAPEPARLRFPVGSIEE